MSIADQSANERLEKARDDFYAALQTECKPGNWHCAALVVTGPNGVCLDLRVIGKGHEDIKETLIKMLNEHQPNFTMANLIVKKV
jgi:hypothetical protein